MNESDDLLSPEEAHAFERASEHIRQALLHRFAEDSRGASAIGFAGPLYGGIERIHAVAQREGVSVACRRGCSHCCHARVEAYAPEVFLIAKELQRLPGQDLHALIARLQAHVADESSAASWQGRPACPFLQNGLCSIYAVRPSACRKAHSLALERCEAGTPQIPQSLKIAAGAAALTQGTLGAYADLGFDTSARELTRSVLAALLDPALEARWQLRQPAFLSDAPPASG